MLHSLHLKNVGPAPEMRMKLARRLNLITGDNGLGKSFLLDLAWWALTRTWASLPAIPRGAGEATLGVQYEGQTKPHEYESRYDRRRQQWIGKKSGRPANPGMVIYARVDGGFAVWDPARASEAGDAPGFVFDAEDVWDGLARRCNGLVRDWATWQLEQKEAWRLLQNALQVMSPSEDEPLRPGALTRVSLDDPRDIPTLRLPYGEVPILHASAGMRRICALVYLLVWTWIEHQRASKLIDQPPTDRIIFLVDEPDTHLHPRWQRVVLRSLLNVVHQLMTKGDAKVQLIAATHSPLVMASVEPLFDPAHDKCWHLDADGELVHLREEAWAKEGDVLGWLASATFGLKHARSLESEVAIEAAEAFMRDDLPAPQHLRTRAAIHAELVRLLAGSDPFWARWIASQDRGPAARSPRRKR
jgi:hypothetical protein